MPQLMWRGSFDEGRIITPREDEESGKLGECESAEELEDLVDEIYSDYDSKAPIWQIFGFCVVDGEDIKVDEISKNWEYRDFFEQHNEDIKEEDCCAIFLDACKGYSQQIEIEEFNSSLLTYEDGVISYDGEELYPDDYRGIGSEKFLFKQGKEVKFE